MLKRSYRYIVLCACLSTLLVPPVRSDLTHRQKEQLNHALIAAIKRNDSQKVMNLLNAGADPNTRDTPPHSDQTALLVALNSTINRAAKGNFTQIEPPIINILLDSGANINVRDKQGNTPLTLAASRAQNDVVLDMLSHGAGVNSRDAQKRTALMWLAADPNALYVLNALLQRRADVNAQDQFGVTALMRAVAHANVGAVQSLLTHHANVNPKDRSGQTALTLAEGGHYSAQASQKIILLLRQAGAKE